MTKKLVLVIPELPDMRLTTNQRHRRNHQEIGRLVKETQERWYWLLCAALVSRRLGTSSQHPFLRVERVRLSWELVYPTRRRIPDDDNIEGALKPIRDLLTVAKKSTGDNYRLGLILDDDPAHLVSTAPVQRYEKGVSRTTITLEEQGAND